MKKHLICASILAADFARLGEEVAAVLDAGADRIHIDVMDNHYVPNLTVGPLVCQALRRYGIKAPLDVHLMVEPVDSLIENFAKAGANCIVFHPEATKHVDRSLQLIKNLGCEAGLALNPASSIQCLEYVLDKIDRILLMSVNPGFGGQSFIPSMLSKAESVAKLIKQTNRHICLEIDGGVKIDNIAKIARTGVQAFVIGSGIFMEDDYAVTIKQLHAELAKV